MSRSSTFDEDCGGDFFEDVTREELCVLAVFELVVFELVVFELVVFEPDALESEGRVLSVYEGALDDALDEAASELAARCEPSAFCAPDEPSELCPDVREAGELSLLAGLDFCSFFDEAFEEPAGDALLLSFLCGVSFSVLFPLLADAEETLEDTLLPALLLSALPALPRLAAAEDGSLIIDAVGTLPVNAPFRENASTVITAAAPSVADAAAILFLR